MRLCHAAILCLLLRLVNTKNSQFAIFPKITNFIEHGQNEECMDHSTKYRQNLQNFTGWAHKMLDASAKSSFGVFRINTYQFGNFDECLDMEGPFETQYCMVTLRIISPKVEKSPDPFNSMLTKLQKPTHHHPQRSDSIQIGLCVPAACSPSEVQSSLAKSFSNPLASQSVTYEVRLTEEAACSIKNNPSKVFGKLDFAFCSLTAILILLTMTATFSDVKSKALPSTSKQMILAFSLRQTWNDLFAAHDEHDQAKIFNCIRTVSIVIVVIGHQGELALMGPWMSGIKLEQMADSRMTYLLTGLVLGVENFFVMSGLLLSFKILLKQKGKSQINPFKLIFRRYIRLTVLYAYVIFFFTTVLKYSGSGPLWNLLMKPQVEVCQNYWFWSLLYLNNIITTGFITCNFVTWYIACEFQLFILGVFVMYIVSRNSRVGHAILGLLLISSLAAAFGVTRAFGILPFMGGDKNEEYLKHLELFYTKPYAHASSYFIGLCGGILYHNFITTKRKISNFAITSWILSASAILISIAVAYLYVFYNDAGENYLYEHALFNTWNKPFWSLGLLGVCIVASFGPVSPVRSFLNSSAWIPFSKLTYAVYLSHLAILFSIISNAVTTMNPQFITEVSSVISNIILSFSVGFLLYFFVEAPLIKLLKMFI